MDKVQFTIPLIYLNFVGLHPEKNSIFSFFRKCITGISYAMIVASSYAEMFTNLDNQDVVVSCIESGFAGVQNACKMLVLVWYKKEIGQLIQNTHRFFPLDHFGRHQQAKMRAQHRIFKLVYSISLAFMNFAIVIYTYASFVNQEPAILSYGQTKGLSPFFQKFYAGLDVVHMTSVICIICGFDGIFFYLIAHVVSELKMIRAGFNDGKNHYQEKLKIMVQHHSYVLR